MKVFLALSTLLAVNANVIVYHRIFHPSFQNSNFVQRGIISGNPPTLRASESFTSDLEKFSKTLNNLNSPSPDALYQVAMTSEATSPSKESKLDYSSVKICHLQQATAESWIFHVSEDDNPFAIDYFVSPIPIDGSCSKGKVFSSAMVQNINTTIYFRKQTIPPQPELRTPPPLTAEGEIAQPPPQKSFIQKYWMYIAGFLLIIMVTGPEDSERPRNNAPPS